MKRSQVTPNASTHNTLLGELRELQWFFLWKDPPIFHGKIHYFYGHFQLGIFWNHWLSHYVWIPAGWMSNNYMPIYLQYIYMHRPYSCSHTINDDQRSRIFFFNNSRSVGFDDTTIVFNHGSWRLDKPSRWGPSSRINHRNVHEI